MMKSDASDFELVEQANAGNRAAFAALVSRHYDMMFRVAWKACGNREDAEDIAQDVSVKLARAISGFSASSKFSTWLYQVVLNAVRDHFRKGQSRRKAFDAFEVDPAFNAQAEEEPDDTAPLWEAVRTLPRKQCEAVLLIYGEGLSHADAAVSMECAESTVSYHIHEAKKKLKVMMAQPERERA